MAPAPLLLRKVRVMFETRTLVWKAMAEADIHRRYHGQLCDSLRRTNKHLVMASWVASVAASVLALWNQVPVQVSIALLILAAAFTTFRDVLRLPDRIADARFILVGTNQEYDKMRVLWETEGKHSPSPEYESFLNVSRLHDLSTERLDADLLKKAESDSRAYHTHLKEQQSMSDTKPDTKRGLPLTTPTPRPPSPDDGGGARQGGLPTSVPPPEPPPKKG